MKPGNKKIPTPEEIINKSIANREIKDGAFKEYFEIPENAAELYSALKKVPCSPDEIKIFTITTIISGKFKNDLAFIVRNSALILGEHVSGPYLNMPVRLLIYIGHLYEKWIKMKEEERFLYGSKLYKIPVPEFVIFYNGVAPRPEKEILYLSNAFETAPGNDLGSLELTVPVYNINKGTNEELFERSPKLKQYSEFIAKIRELGEIYNDYTRAVKEAVDYCIANDILADFLREQGGRIVSILLTEFDLDVAKKVWREEALEEGMERGMKEGMERGMEKGMERGMEKGMEKGQIKMAKIMLANREPMEKIVMYTGLSCEKIENMRR